MNNRLNEKSILIIAEEMLTRHRRGRLGLLAASCPANPKADSKDHEGSLRGESNQPMELDTDNTSSAESDTAEAIEDQHLLFYSVFGNDLLWDKISGYLNATDLKSASLVNRLFLHKIRGQKNFIDGLKLIICRDSFKKKILSKTRLRWKKCDIELSTLPPKALPAIRRILQSIESVELYEAYGVSEKDRIHFLKEIIPNAQNLRSLTVDCSILERLNSSLLAEQDMKEKLVKLEELKIVTGRNDESKMVSCSDGPRSAFPQNILKLSQQLTKLRSFEFQKIDTYYGSQKEHVAYIPQLIENNRQTLQNLKLQLHVWSLDSMKTLVCPALKSLHITAYRRNDGVVKAFLEKQPLLESLIVQFKSGFPLSVIKTIASRGTKLRKLHLKATSFTESPDLIDWSFLLTFQSLTDFQIFQPRAFIGPNETQGTCSQYFNALPDCLQKINLRGLEHGWAGDITTNTTTCLQRFRNLTGLSLMRCEETMNDEILQFICSTLTKLKILQFSHTQSVTDFGLTGKRHIDGNEVDTGISLKKLKGLVQLTMRECRLVTDEALIASIEFLQLSKLDLAIRSDSLDKATIVQLVRQNPSLETLTVHFSPENCEKELKSVNGRFKSILCIQDDWNLEDSDSDAEELDDEFDQSSENDSFDSWDWDSDLDDDDDIIIWGPPGGYSDLSDIEDI